MNVCVSEPHLTPDLLAYLRGRGCIAYSEVGGEITALAPDLTGAEEAQAVTALATEWGFAHPGVDVMVTR
jgi:hypothetical protein